LTNYGLEEAGMAQLDDIVVDGYEQTNLIIGGPPRRDEALSISPRAC
jgi:hypothetical protein